MKGLDPAIRQHCEAKAIRAHQLPSGALRFIGPGVDLIVARGQRVNLSDLEPYEARKGYALRNV